MYRRKFTNELKNVIDDSFGGQEECSLSEDDVEFVRAQIKALCDATLEVIAEEGERRARREVERRVNTGSIE